MEHSQDSISKDLLRKDSTSKDLISKDSLRKDSYHKDLFHRHNSFPDFLQTVKTNSALSPMDRIRTDSLLMVRFQMVSLRTDRLRMGRIRSRLKQQIRL